MGRTEPRSTTPGASALDWGYIGYVREKDTSPGRWEALATGNPPVLQFWYRQSPRPIVSCCPAGSVYWSKPGLDVTDMAGVTYDMSGRLLRFYAIPPQLESDAAGPPPRPGLVAPLRRGAARPRRVPRGGPALDAALPHRRARGVGGGVAGAAGHPVRIEAAAYRGRPVWFEVITPWTKPERMEAYAGRRASSCGS